MAPPWAFGVEELPQAYMCFLQDGRVLFSKAYALGSQLIKRQWEALFLSLVHASLLSGEERLSFLHSAAQVMLLEPKSDHTVTCSDSSNSFPSQVITQPKIPSIITSLMSHLIPFYFLGALPLPQPQWPSSPCSETHHAQSYLRAFPSSVPST